MLNRIWFWLLFIGIVYGFGKASLTPIASQPSTDPVVTTAVDSSSTIDETNAASATRSGLLRDTGQGLTDAALGAAKTSVELCIVLIGVMALWLGMLNIAKDAGLVDQLARLLQPLMRWLFPEVPDGHPAQGAMLMNIAANMLGLGNAATPFGLKAMKELQTLNPTEDTATNAMATFLAINTSNVTLIPITLIGLRVAAGSKNAAAPLAGVLLTTTITTIVAIIAVRALSRLPGYAMPTANGPTPDAANSGPREAEQ